MSIFHITPKQAKFLDSWLNGNFGLVIYFLLTFSVGLQQLEATAPATVPCFYIPLIFFGIGANQFKGRNHDPRAFWMFWFFQVAGIVVTTVVLANFWPQLTVLAQGLAALRRLFSFNGDHLFIMRLVVACATAGVLCHWRSEGTLFTPVPRV